MQLLNNSLKIISHNSMTISHPRSFRIKYKYWKNSNIKIYRNCTKHHRSPILIWLHIVIALLFSLLGNNLSLFPINQLPRKSKTIGISLYKGREMFSISKKFHVNNSQIFCIKLRI